MADMRRRIVAEFSAKNKAKGVMAGLTRDMDSVGRTMRRMAVGALAVAGVGGLGYMLKRQMEVIDSTAKLSDRLNINTADLVAMQHGAKIAGVETETFNKALEIFVRRLGEVDMGVGQASYALDKLGLDYKELIGLSADEAFGKIADQINRLSTQAEKAAAANYLFGRSGQSLLNFFEKGSAGLKEYKEFVEKTGYAFSRLDAAQVEAANDALENVRITMAGIFRQGAIELAPYIETIANKFIDVATAGDGLGANVSKVFEMLSIGAIKFGESLNAIPATLSSIKAGMYDVASYWDAFVPGTLSRKYLRKIKGEKQPSQIAAEFRAQAQQQKQMAAQQINAIEKFYEDLRTKAADRGKTKKTIKEQYADALRAKIALVDKEIAVNQKRIDFMKQSEGFFLEATTEEHRKAADEVDKVWTEMWLRQQTKEYHAMRGPIIEAERLEAEKAERRKRIAEDIAYSMASSWTNALDRMAFEGQKFWESMIMMARSLVREIANIMIYKMAAEPIATGIMKGFTFGGTPDTFTNPQAVYGSPDIPGMQHGGLVLETGIAKVHKGESFSGVNNNFGGTHVIIHNEGQEKLVISQAEEYLLGDKRIVDVTMKAMTTDLNYQGAMARAIAS